MACGAPITWGKSVPAREGDDISITVAHLLIRIRIITVTVPKQNLCGVETPIWIQKDKEENSVLNCDLKD